MKTVILSFSIAHNSVGEYFIKLSNSLAAQFRVIIVTDKILEHPFTIDPSIEIRKWPSDRPTKFKDFWFLYRLMREMRPAMTISIFGSVNLFLVAGWLANVKRRICWIRTLSTQFPQKKSNVVRKQLVYKLATNVITNSEATRRDAISIFNVDAGKIKVVPNAVADDFLQFQSDIDVNKIIYVGRLHPSKGVDVLIKAFAEVHEKFSSITLEIVGSGSQKEALEKLAADLGVKDSITFRGTLPKTEVMASLSSAYCSIIPSNAEAFGYTVIESMSMRTCVIGADNTGISEIIIDNESGLKFKTGNFNDLADKLSMILSDKPVRDRLANGGYARFKSHYDLEMAVDRDGNFFKSLL